MATFKLSSLEKFQIEKAEAEAVQARTAAAREVRLLAAIPGATLDSEQAAAYLGTVTAGTLSVLRCNGGGPAFVPGPRVRYRPADLDAWLAIPRRNRKGTPRAGRPRKSRRRAAMLAKKGAAA